MIAAGIRPGSSDGPSTSTCSSTSPVSPKENETVHETRDWNGSTTRSAGAVERKLQGKSDTVRRTILTALAVATAAACNDAQIASSNLSRAADDSKIMRRVVFLNGITDTYLL